MLSKDDAATPRHQTRLSAWHLRRKEAYVLTLPLSLPVLGDDTLTPLALSHTHGLILVGILRPRSRWSMIHVPTTNCCLPSIPFGATGEALPLPLRDEP